MNPERGTPSEAEINFSVEQSLENADRKTSTTEIHDKPEAREGELNISEAIQQEKTLLERFQGKAGDIARALLLVTALSTPEFAGAVEPAKEKAPEPQKIEKSEKQAQQTEGVRIEFREGEKVPEGILKNVDIIYLSVIHNGEPQTIALSKQELSKNPKIDVDGYIGNIIVFQKEEMPVELNRKESAQDALRVSDVETSLFRSKTSSSFSPEDLTSDVRAVKELEKLIQQRKITDTGAGQYIKGLSLLGDNVKNPSYLGMPMNTMPENILTLRWGEATHDFPISQKIPEIIKNFSGDPENSIDDLSFEYLGNQRLQFESAKETQEKLTAIAEGVQSVEQTFGANFADTIKIIDFRSDAGDNAFAEQQEPFLGFHRELIEKNSAKDLRVIAEHETLHKYVARRGLSDSPQLREVFADLKGYEGALHQRIVDEGTSVFDNFNPQYENKIFFAFLNEKNFFNISKGGHSHADIWEFLASFSHSLMDFDQLKANLERPFPETDPFSHKIKERLLTQEEKASIVENYLKVAGAVRQTLGFTTSQEKSQSGFNGDREFWDNAFSAIQHLHDEPNKSPEK